MSLIYLDYNRTTPLAPSVGEAMEPYWSTHFMLPDQEHPYAQAIGEALESARESVAFLVGCEPFEIVFTSGGTEANNLAIVGTLREQPPGHLLVSALEHQSVNAPASHLAAIGWQVDTVECDPLGRIDAERVGSLIQHDTRLVCVQLANPVLGTIQPVREIAEVCHQRGVLLHCDATQAIGKIPVDVGQLNADMLAISGHKFYGPKGSGALYIRRGLGLSPIAYGEPREMGLRPGAENIPAWIGLGAAASLASRAATDSDSSLDQLCQRLVKGVLSSVNPAPRILCESTLRLPNTVAMEFSVSARKIQKAARHLAVASPRSDHPPDEMTQVLRAIGSDPSAVARTIRFSVGWTTTRDQIDRAIELLADALESSSSH